MKDKVFKVLWVGTDGLTQENFLFAGSKGDALESLHSVDSRE